jgi:hypothetical protein
MTTTILEFPKHKIVREVPKEVSEERMKKAERKFAESIVDEITGALIGELDNYNLDVSSEEFSKDFVLASDAIKAVVYRQFGIEHHLHTFIDNNIKFVALEGEALEEAEKNMERFQQRLDKLTKDLKEEKELEVEPN